MDLKDGDEMRAQFDSSMGTTSDHTTHAIKRRDDEAGGWVAYCSCGWRVVKKEGFGRARMAAAAHFRMMNRKKGEAGIRS